MEEARHGWEKRALWQTPSLDAGGKTALFGCPHCPRGRGQTQVVRRALSGKRPFCPRGRSQTRAGNGHSADALAAPVEGQTRVLSGRRPPCPRGRTGSHCPCVWRSRAAAAPVIEISKNAKRFCWAVEMLGRRRNTVKLGILAVFGPKPWTPPRRPWKRPGAGGKRALSGRRPPCPRGRSQTRVGNGHSAGCPHCPCRRGQTRVAAGALFGRHPPCPRGSSQTPSARGN